MNIKRMTKQYQDIFNDEIFCNLCNKCRKFKNLEISYISKKKEKKTLGLSNAYEYCGHKYKKTFEEEESM